MTTNSLCRDSRKLDALMGEIVLCPDCGLIIAEFRSDAISGEPWPLDLRSNYMPGTAGRCPDCGARWMRLVNSNSLTSGKLITTLDWIAAKLSQSVILESYAQVYIQSGNWRGWRSLNGE